MPSHANAQPPSLLGYSLQRGPFSPYIQVLLTYLRRPGYHALAVALAVSVALVGLINHLNRIYWFHTSSWLFKISNNTVWILFLMLAMLAPFALSVALAAILVAQVREQLLDWRSRTFPGYRHPHVMAATAVLALVSVFVSVAFYITAFWFGNPGGFPELLAIVTTLVTFMAWTAVRWSPAVGPAVILLLLLFSVEPHVKGAAVIVLRFLNEHRAVREVLAAQTGQLLCILLAAGEILLLPRMLRTTNGHGGMKRPLTSERSRRAPKTLTRDGDDPSAPRRIVEGVLARAWHRRRAVLPPWAAAWIGVALGALLVIGPLLSVPHREPTIVLRGLLLATLTPGIIAAAIWRERWPILGLESLFPARRRDFVRETLLSMAMNLAEVWLAGAAAAVVAVTSFHPLQLSFAAFAASLAASALAQGLIFGVLVLLTPLRATIPYLVIVTLLMIAIAIPFELAWTAQPELTSSRVFTIAAAGAILGIGLASAGVMRWKASELA